MPPISASCCPRNGISYIGISQAGNYAETEQTSTLAVGGAVSLHRCPTNQGAAIGDGLHGLPEAPAGATYQVSINQNSTGRALNLRLLGVNGTIAASSATAVNGTCALPALAMAGNLDFGTVVATAKRQPVVANGHYILLIRRTA